MNGSNVCLEFNIFFNSNSSVNGFYEDSIKIAYDIHSCNSSESIDMSKT